MSNSHAVEVAVLSKQIQSLYITSYYYITHFFANTLQLQTNVHFRPLFVKLSIILPYEYQYHSSHGVIGKEIKIDNMATENIIQTLKDIRDGRLNVNVLHPDSMKIIFNT